MPASDPQPTSPRNDETTYFSREGFTPPTPAELNARIPNLEVIELLGHGGMGVVYKGRQPLLDRLVAIKVLRPDFQTDDDFQERFLREARTLAKLRHPYIVTVYDIGKSDQLYYLVMEFVEGANLRQLLADGSITERDTLEFVPQITEALQHAHETGIVHRDIKPENVLIDPRGRVRLVDFGLATLFGPQRRAVLTRTGWPALSVIWLPSKSPCPRPSITERTSIPPESCFTKCLRANSPRLTDCHLRGRRPAIPGSIPSSFTRSSTSANAGTKKLG